MTNQITENLVDAPDEFTVKGGQIFTGGITIPPLRFVRVGNLTGKVYKAKLGSTGGTIIVRTVSGRPKKVRRHGK